MNNIPSISFEISENYYSDGEETELKLVPFSNKNKVVFYKNNKRIFHIDASDIETVALLLFNFSEQVESMKNQSTQQPQVFRQNQLF
jgi:hypothetical protein